MIEEARALYHTMSGINSTITRIEIPEKLSRAAELLAEKCSEDPNSFMIEAIRQDIIATLDTIGDDHDMDPVLIMQPRKVCLD